MEDKTAALKAQYQDYSYAQLGAEMLVLKREYEDLKRIATEAYNRYNDFIRKVIPSRLEDDGLDGVFVEVNGMKKRLTVLDQVTVKTIKDKKPELWHWLREMGAEDLITETVHSSTLAGYVREQLREGTEVPEDCLEISTYQQASLVST